MYNFVKCQNTILQFRFFCTIDPNFIIEKNYVHLVFLIVSKANDVVKIVWTLSGFNFSAIAGLWRPLEAVLQPLMQLELQPVHGTQIALHHRPNRGL